MSDPFVGQVKMFGFGFAPKNYAACNGQILPIQQNSALFSLLGVYYGGNGTVNFGLPDLRGRVPLGAGTTPSSVTYTQGEFAGTENVTLLGTELPPHTHTVAYTGQTSASRNPAGGLYGNTGASPLYASGGQQMPLNPATVTMNGGTTPHPNVQPFSVLNFCIALSGIYPSRS